MLHNVRRSVVQGGSSREGKLLEGLEPIKNLEESGSDPRGSKESAGPFVTSKLEVLDHRYRQMFFKSKPKVQRALDDIRAVQSCQHNSHLQGDQGASWMPKSKVKAGPEAVRGWRATRSQQTQRTRTPRYEQPTAVSPASAASQRQALLQTIQKLRLTDERNTLHMVLTKRSNKPTLQEFSVNQTHQPGSETMATASQVQTQTMSPTMGHRNRLLATELQLESLQDSLFSHVNPRSNHRAQHQLRGPKTSTDPQPTVHSRNLGSHQHASAKGGAQRRYACKPTLQAPRAKKINYEQSFHRAYQRQSMEYQAQLQRARHCGASLAQVEGDSPLPPCNQRRSLKSEAKHAIGERGAVAQATETVYVKEIIRERQKLRDLKSRQDFASSFEGLRHKVDGASVRCPFLTKDNAHTKAFQLNILRSGLLLENADKQESLRNNVTLAQKAIENYAIMNEPASGTIQGTRFQGFELYKRTSGKSGTQNDTEQPSKPTVLDSSLEERSKTMQSQAMTAGQPRGDLAADQKSVSSNRVDERQRCSRSPTSLRSSTGPVEDVPEKRPTGLQARSQIRRAEHKKRRHTKVSDRDSKLRFLVPGQSHLGRWRVDDSGELPQARVDAAVEHASGQLPDRSQNMTRNAEASLPAGDSADIDRRRQVMSADDMVSQGSSRVFSASSQFNIKNTQTHDSNQFIVRSDQTSKHPSLLRLKNNTSAGNSATLHDGIAERERRSQVESGQDHELLSPQILEEDHSQRSPAQRYEQIYLHKQERGANSSVLVHSFDDHPTRSQAAQKARLDDIVSSQVDFLFSTQREDEQQQRVEGLLDNFELIKNDAKAQLQGNVEGHPTDMRKQWAERGRFVTHSARQKRVRAQASMPEGDELLRQFRALLKESNKEAKAKKTEHQIMADYMKQDMFVATMQRVVKRDIEHLEEATQLKDKIVFEELFDFLQDQVVRDQVSAMYMEFKKQQTSEDRLEKERQAALVKKQRRMADPENQRKIQETIEGADARLECEKEAKEAQEEEELNRMKNFESYLESRDVVEEARRNTGRLKAKYLQLYKKLQANPTERVRACEEVCRMAKLFGAAETEPMQIILQKIRLNKRRDERENAQALREMALRGPVEEQFRELVFDLCHDPTRAHGRNFLNAFFQEAKNRNEKLPLEGWLRSEAGRDEHDVELEWASPELHQPSVLTADSALRTPSGGLERVAGPLHAALTQYTKLPPHEQDLVNKNDFDGYDLEYISHILKLHAALRKLFKFQNLGEVYEAAERNMFLLPQDVSGLHLLRQIKEQVEKRGKPTKSIQELQAESRLMRQRTAQRDTESAADYADQSPTILRGEHWTATPKAELRESDADEDAQAQFAAQKPIEVRSLVAEQIEKRCFYERMKTGHAYWNEVGQPSNSNMDTFNVHWPGDEFAEEEDWYSMARSPMEQLNDFLAVFKITKALPIPSFTKIKVIHGFKQLYMAQYAMSEEQCLALRNFLISQLSLTSLSANPASLVTPPQFLDVIVLDNCGLSDEGFAQVLVGLLAQKTIRSISYLNNRIGSKSVRVLEDLLDGNKSQVELFEFNLHNTEGLSIDLARRLTRLLEKSRDLLNLKLSQINLNDEEVVQSLCSIISTNHKTLQRFDISATCLCSKYLCELAENFAVFPDFTRQLNLSFLNINSKLEPEYAQQFLQQFIGFLEHSQTLMYINLSGMGLTREELLAVVAALANARQLQGVHLSDQCLVDDEGLAKEVLSKFGVEVGEAPKDPEPARVNCRQEIKAFLQKVDPSLVQQDDDDPKYVGLVDNREHYVKGLTVRQITENKRRNLALEGRGVGKTAFSRVDSFVLTRRLNYPELAFKERLSASDSHFCRDSQSSWRLQSDGSCYLCEKHKYCVIFFDQSNLRANESHNMGFKRIRDEAFCSYLRENFLKDGRQGGKGENPQAPTIFGTFNKRIELGNNMMNSSIFAFLSVHEEEEISQKPEYAQAIKSGLTALLNDPSTESIFAFQQQLTGYGSILRDKVTKNELVDVCCLNTPSDFSSLSHNSRLYTYAAYLPPGHHQVIVHCPKSGTFWYKDVLLDLSEHIPITEHPQRPAAIVDYEKMVPNVWALGPQPPSLDELFRHDLRQIGTHSFLMAHGLQKLVNKKRTIRLLQDNFNTLCNLFDFLKVRSESSVFPLVSYAQITEYFTTTIQVELGDAESVPEGEAAQAEENPGKHQESPAATAGADQRAQAEMSPRTAEEEDAEEVRELSPLEQMIESAYFASKHPCKLMPGETPTETPPAEKQSLSPADKKKFAAEAKRLEEQLELFAQRKEDSLAKHADRGNLLTFLLQLAKQLSLSCEYDWGIETHLQLLFHKIEEHLLNEDIEKHDSWALHRQGNNKSRR